jgi:hypothetical protein
LFSYGYVFVLPSDHAAKRFNMKYGQNYEETFNPLAKICPRLCDWWHKTPRDGYSMPRSCFALFVCGGGRGTTRCSYRPSDRCRSSFLCGVSERVWCRNGVFSVSGSFSVVLVKVLRLL